MMLEINAPRDAAAPRTAPPAPAHARQMPFSGASVDATESSPPRPTAQVRRSLSLRQPRSQSTLQPVVNAAGRRPAPPADALVQAFRATPAGEVEARAQLLNALADLADAEPSAVRDALRFKFAPPRHTLDDICTVLRHEMGREQAQRIVADLLEMAWDLRCAGKSRLVIVNATFDGGGVAELFQTCAEILKLVRIDVEWHTTLAADNRFTEVGRKVFDVLQGNSRPISDEELALWERENVRLGRILQGVATDRRVAAVFVEDHHPVHLVEQLQVRRRAAGVLEPLKIVWRSHVDNANLLARADAPMRLWERAFKPQLSRLGPRDAVLFQPGSVPQGVSSFPCGVFTQPPGTNPLAAKNVTITFPEMAEILRRVAPGVNVERPYLVTGGRFVGWKGLLPVMRAHRRLMQDFPDIDHLMFGTVGTGDARKVAYHALVQAEARDFARQYPAQAARFQIVRDQKDDIRAFYAKAKFDRMPVALMSIAEGYNMMADELTYQGALPMTTRQGGLSRFAANPKLAGVTLDIADLVRRLGDPAEMYRLAEDGGVVAVSPVAEELETRIAEHLKSWFSFRAAEPEAYASAYDARAKVAHDMALEASNIAMCRAYLGLSLANGRFMDGAKRDIRSREGTAPTSRLVDYIMHREFNFLGPT